MPITPRIWSRSRPSRPVKYRYLRAVDLRDWDLLATDLTEDATAAYAAGS